MGKGCRRRPQQVDDQTMKNNWSKIFNRKDQLEAAIDHATKTQEAETTTKAEVLNAKESGL